MNYVGFTSLHSPRKANPAAWRSVTPITPSLSPNRDAETLPLSSLVLKSELRSLLSGLSAKHGPTAALLPGGGAEAEVQATRARVDEIIGMLVMLQGKAAMSGSCDV